MNPIFWKGVKMDLPTDLPFVDGLQVMLTVVDHFSKMLNLLPLGPNTMVKLLAHKFFNTVV